MWLSSTVGTFHDNPHRLVTELNVLPVIMVFSRTLYRLAPHDAHILTLLALVLSIHKHQYDLGNLLHRREVVCGELGPFVAGEQIGPHGSGANSVDTDTILTVIDWGNGARESQNSMLGSRIDGREDAGVEGATRGSDDQRPISLGLDGRKSKVMSGQRSSGNYRVVQNLDNLAQLCWLRRGLDAILVVYVVESAFFADAGIGIDEINALLSDKDGLECLGERGVVGEIDGEEGNVGTDAGGGSEAGGFVGVEDVDLPTGPEGEGFGGC
jgi:hypothetical protein